MRTEQLARAQLFSTIEGGSIFWSSEIAELGPLEVKDRIIFGHYGRLHSGLKISERLKQTSGEEVLSEISQAGAFILTPEDETSEAN